MTLTDVDRQLLIRALTFMKDVWTGPQRDHARHLIGALILDLDRKEYTCPRCGMISANVNDLLNRYCAACHRFEEQPT